MNTITKGQQSSYKLGYCIPTSKRLRSIDELLDTDEDRILFGRFHATAKDDRKPMQKTSRGSGRSYARN